MKKLALLLPLLLIFLSACGANTTPAPVEATPTLPAAQAATLAPQATLTVPPTAVPGKILVIADSASRGAAEALAAIGHDLAFPAGAREVKVIGGADFTAASLTPEVKLVVALVPVPNLDQIAAAAPAVTFVGVAASDQLKPAANLSVILAAPEAQAYLAGFITTIISPDWRSTGLLLLPGTAGPLSQAFINGAGYYCGRCSPIRGPIVIFPLVAETTAAGSADAFNKFLADLPETVYIDAAVSSPDLIKNVASHKLVALGTLPAGQKPDPSLQAAWAVTLHPDLLSALKTLWPDLSAAKGGRSVTAGFAYTDLNPQYFTPGKQRLAQVVIDGLVDGSIAPLTPVGQ